MQKDRSEGISIAVSNGHGKESQKSAQINEPLLTVIHFNDVYDLQPKGGSMGVCHFKAKVEQLRKENPKAITLFSGDCFSPSTLTNIKGGEQMVFALNKLGIDCACYGNHQFDFQTEHTLKLARNCNWPWLMGNIRMSATGELLGDGRPFLVKEHNGLRIGILGVAGEDWLGILSDEYEGMLEYQDCYEFSNRTVKHLREQEKCDVVIALTHMRNNADKEFPHKVKGVDLVLGGHDHVIMQEFIEGIPVIKSGTNFNHVGLIKLYSKSHKTAKQGNNFNYQWKISKVTVSEHIDADLKKYVDNLMQEYSQYDDVIGYTDMPLQTRFTRIRTEESNLGNFFADLARLYYDTDICTINAGMIRNDALIPPGKLTYSKISNIIDSPMVAKRYSGKVVFDFLEYAVSQYPGFAGQFPFISGMRFQFDHLLKPRVRNVWVGGEKLDLQREYSITTTFYQSRGGDGYDMLKGGQTIVDEVKGTTMLNLLLKFFKAPDTHQQYESIKVASKSLSNSSDQQNDLPGFPTQMLSLVRKFSVRLGRIKDLRSRYVMDSNGQPLTSIAPIVDGRITCLSKVDLQDDQ